MPASATYEPIATTTLSSDQSTITLSSISSSYTDLRVVIRAMATNGCYIVTRYNGDTGSNYSTTQLYGNGTSALSTRGSNNTFCWNLYQSWLDGTNPALCVIDIFNYSGSTYKTALTVASNDKNGSGTVERNVSLWRSTSAINSIEFSTDSGGSYKTGTMVTIYGIKSA